MATKDTELQLSTLIINKVDSLDTFQEMIEGDIVNDDELYFIEGSDQDLGLSVVGGMLCMTYELADPIVGSAPVGYTAI